MSREGQSRREKQGGQGCLVITPACLPHTERRTGGEDSAVSLLSSNYGRNAVICRDHEGKVDDGAAMLLLEAALPDR